MADSNPYANLGQSMLGQDASIAKQMSTPDSLMEKIQKAAGGGGAANPLAILAYAAADKLGDMFGGGGEGGGSAPWTSSSGTGASLFRAIVPPPPSTGGGNFGVPPVQAQSGGQPMMPSTPQAPQPGGLRGFFGIGNK